MAQLTTKARKALPARKFALEATRQYPIHDAAHARNAKARAQQMFEAGKLSRAKRDEVFREADIVLKRKD